MTLRLLSIRRWPVKAMGGEALARVHVGPRGLAGDRWHAVRDDEGRFASGKSTRRFRRRDGVFAFAASTDGDGVVRVRSDAGEWRVGDPRLDAHLTHELAAPVTVVEESSVPHHDARPVSLVGTATLRWCAERWGLDADPRRLRANLVVETREPFEEESWIGGAVGVGDVRLAVVERVARCRTIDVDQDGVVADGAWLRALGAERDACIAVYADVARGGTVAVGDEVRHVGLADR